MASCVQSLNGHTEAAVDDGSVKKLQQGLDHFCSLGLQIIRTDKRLYNMKAEEKIKTLLTIQLG